MKRHHQLSAICAGLAIAIGACVVPAQTQPAPGPAVQPAPPPQPNPPPTTQPPPPQPVPPVTTQPVPPPRPPIPPPRPSWDSRGWTLLATKTISPTGNRDLLKVGKDRGSFNEITLVSKDADFQLDGVNVVFFNTKKFFDNSRHRFTQRSIARKYQIAQTNLRISHVSIAYSSLARNRQATVEVWGRSGAQTPPPRPPVVRPEPPKWNSGGWTKLGEKWVNGRRDRDVFNLRNRGAFTHVTFVVSESDLEMFDVNMVFGNRQDFSPNVRHYFKNGSRSRAINLPGHQRNIRKVEFKYGNLPGTGRAKVAIWGRSDAPAPQRPTFNSRGWTKLGEKWVNGGRDKDTFNLSNRGAFTHLTVVVSESDLRMFEMEMKFGNGKKFSPKLAHIFRNGSRSQAINLPGYARNIRKVKFKYGNLPGTGRAKVTLYGRNKAPAPTKPNWNGNGWTLLGEKWVNGNRDKDVIRVGRKRGVFSHVAFVVSESDLQVEDVVVTFGNRQQFTPKIRHIFKNGTRSRKINLPGNVRNIQTIGFKYGNLPGTGRAKVSIWAKAGVQAPGDGNPGQWTPVGWSKLGSKVVTGNRRNRPDRDRLTVGKNAKKWRKITLQATGSDLELFNVEVTFANGSTFKPRVRHFFKEGGRTRRIDLPGEARKIKHIDFTYGNVPGGGRATMNVWAK